MSTPRGNLLPQWTWEDLEAALDGFSPSGANDPVRQHLLRGLADDAEQSSPREFLQQVLSAGWVMAQVGAQNPDSATDPRRVAGASAS
ncbi:hypothetical protein [Brevundimonas lenta]|uniref:Uncharacterized protein n=1 Tax=Brevundimonas lenta TaxID=424796 RepID=A0A7W6NP17_9CAUL|nr:hypothetical protein [Brevundimonas lenta]MBB4081737.1 hypothetical protein [Brevundimonas lenta]